MKSVDEVEQIKEICNGVAALVSAVVDREFEWSYDNDKELITFKSSDDDVYHVNVHISSVQMCLRDIARQFIAVVRF